MPNLTSLLPRMLALALVACGGAPPRPDSVTSSNVPGAYDPGATVTSAGPSDGASPCDGEPRCVVVARTAAGTDAAGVPLLVVETSRGLRSVETGEPTDDPAERSCERHEYHLERAGTFEPVLSLCNDGYGASGVGEDTVTIAANRLVHDQYGGSSWRWATHTEEQLAPRRLLVTSLIGYWNLGPNAEERRFDVGAFEGRVSWYSPACGSEDAESGEMREVPEAQRRAYVIVPIVALDPRFDPETMPVRSCGTRVDATSARSFLTFGARGDADDAWLEVLATREHELIVLVHDDRFVAAADRLAVHVGPSASGYAAHCLEPTNEHRSVVFDASSGAVIEGDATAIGARTGSAPGGRFVRFSVPEGGAVTLAYTDADERGTERTFATSALEEGDTHSLCAVGTGLEGFDVSCVMEQGVLVRAVRETGPT